MAWYEAGVVDHDVPFASAQGIKLAVAIACKPFNRREKLRVRYTSVE
jgi:hypothetical protein